MIENCFVRGWTYENILDCSFGAIVGVIFWGQVTCKNCYVLNNAENENWGTPGYRGDFFADAHANTNSSFTAMNCYATSNEFAAVSDNLAGFTTKIVNCYKMLMVSTNTIIIIPREDTIAEFNRFRLS